jgi:hypothetical protein
LPLGPWDDYLRWATVETDYRKRFACFPQLLVAPDERDLFAVGREDAAICLAGTGSANLRKPAIRLMLEVTHADVSAVSSSPVSECKQSSVGGWVNAIQVEARPCPEPPSGALRRERRRATALKRVLH